VKGTRKSPPFWRAILHLSELFELKRPSFYFLAFLFLVAGVALLPATTLLRLAGLVRLIGLS
jgi:hypothetical protein